MSVPGEGMNNGRKTHQTWRGAGGNLFLAGSECRVSERQAAFKYLKQNLFQISKVYWYLWPVCPRALPFGTTPSIWCQGSVSGSAGTTGLVVAFSPLVPSAPESFLVRRD